MIYVKRMDRVESKTHFIVKSSGYILLRLVCSSFDVVAQTPCISGVMGLYVALLGVRNDMKKTLASLTSYGG